MARGEARPVVRKDERLVLAARGHATRSLLGRQPPLTINLPPSPGPARPPCRLPVHPAKLDHVETPVARASRAAPSLAVGAPSIAELAAREASRRCAPVAALWIAIAGCEGARHAEPPPSPPVAATPAP